MDIMPIVASSFVVKSSPRRDDILAAIKNPINTELVEQLVSYLDDKYTQPIQRDRRVAAPAPAEQITPSSGSGSAAPAPRGGEPSLASLFGDDIDSEMPENGEASEPAEPSETLEEPPMDEEMSPNSATALDSLDSIQAALNASETTAGVRASKQLNGDEIWLYYQDAVNLNKVMDAVIDSMPANFEFSRLARSSNAIVFTVR